MHFVRQDKRLGQQLHFEDCLDDDTCPPDTVMSPERAESFDTTVLVHPLEEGDTRGCAYGQ